MHIHRSAVIEAACAHLAIPVVPADKNLLTFANTASTLVSSQIHGGPLATFTDRFDLFDVFSKREQRRRAREWVALEVRADCKANDRNSLPVNPSMQVTNLLEGKKLCFVN